MDPHTPTELKLNLFPAPRIQRRPSSWDPSQPLPVHQFYQLQAYSKMPGPERTSPTARPVVQPPRPPNAWIIFRSEMSRILPPVAPGQPGRPQSAVSRTIADLWANLDPKTKQQYERRAEAKKAEHALKYPNYRFTPVKKEEKERIREEKRLIKEAQTKGQSRRGRAKPPTNASSSSSNPYMMMPVPMTSYYPPPPQLFPSVPNYGPLGPSPPVSAASSPNDSGLYSESSHSSPSADLSQSQVPAALPYSAMMTMMTPQSSGMGASVSPPSQSQSQSPQPGPSHWAPQQEDNASSSSLVPDWSTLAPSQAGYMSSQPSTPADTQSVQFNIPQPTAAQSWMPTNMEGFSFDESLTAFLSQTGDPNIFQLSNLDPESLVANPSGEIEVSLGDEFALAMGDNNIFNTPDFNFDFSGFSDPSSSQSSDFTSPLTPDPNAAFFLNQHAAPSGEYNADDYINFDNAAVDPSLLAQQPSPPAPVASSSSAPAGSYRPPTGAAHSGTRRVAASWPSSFAMTDNQRSLSVPAN